MSYLKQRPGSVEETITKLSSKVLESDYQDKFKKELEKAGKGIGSMTPDEKKKFFNKIDKMHTAKNEMAKGDAYAIGMAQAKKSMNDEPPLDKKTITKGHEIAKSILKKEDLDETHVGQTDKANQSQKDAKGEKEPIKPIKETILDMWKEAAEKKDEKKKDATPPVDNSDEEPKKEEPKKEEESADKAKAEAEKAKDEVQILKQRIETEKTKQVQQQVNPETGEPLLKVGVAYKHLADKMKMKKESVASKKEEEEQNKNKKVTDTGEKPSEIEKNPEIKYDK